MATSVIVRWVFMRITLKREDISSFLDYNLESGVFTWKFRDRSFFKTNLAFSIWNKKYAGKEAGSIRPDRWGKKYRIISIFDHPYKAHRLAFLLVTGEMPTLTVDHINGNGVDNRWENIRVVTNDENQRNKSRPKNNKSGAAGVYLNKDSNLWDVTIQKNKKQTRIGSFASFDEAVLCRKLAENQNGYHPNHGR